MANILEERILSYIQNNSSDGHILIKLDDLASDLGETKNPVYRALNSLEKKRKIRKENRSKMGVDITLINKTQVTSSNNNLLNIDQNNNKSNDNSSNLYQITAWIPSLSLQELKIIKDIVELNIIRKEGYEKNE